METTNNTQYNSLGEMAKAGDYPLLLEKLQQYEGTDDMKILTSLDDRPYSELEELLFRMSRFALKPQKKEDNEETLLNDILINDIQNNKKELYTGFLEVVDIILKNGADPNRVIVNGITPFMMACTVDNPDFMQKLLNNPYKYEDLKTGEYVYKKADLNMGDGKGNRPFYYATMSGALSVMDVLAKEYNVDIDQQYFLSENKTVFHYVCQNFTDKVTVDPDGLTYTMGNENKEFIIDKLIELGANPTLLDNYENLPEELVPTFDETIHSAEDVTEEEIALWDKVYEKIGNYRKAYENNNTNKHKLVF